MEDAATGGGFPSSARSSCFARCCVAQRRLFGWKLIRDLRVSPPIAQYERIHVTKDNVKRWMHL